MNTQGVQNLFFLVLQLFDLVVLGEKSYLLDLVGFFELFSEELPELVLDSLHLGDALDEYRVVGEGGGPFVIVLLQLDNPIPKIDQGQQMQTKRNDPECLLITGNSFLNAGDLDHESIADFGHMACSVCRVVSGCCQQAVGCCVGCVWGWVAQRLVVLQGVFYCDCVVGACGEN